MGKLEEGVVGWVESDSEGACDVAGVSMSDVGATVCASTSLRSSLAGIFIDWPLEGSSSGCSEN